MADASGSRAKEFTIRAVLIGLVLAMALGAANMYVGLKVGLTVSASIPASVMALAALRGLRNSHVREANIAQTVASSAEAQGAGVIFTFPALLVGGGVFLGIWTDIDYWTVAGISLIAGVLGVLFAVPLRKALIVDEGLAYPEGVAAANVLQAGFGGAGGGLLLVGLGAGAVFAAMQLGTGFYPEATATGWKIGASAFSLQLALSPLLLAIGYLVGFRISALVFGGGAFAWFLLIPVISASGYVPGLENVSGLGAATLVWDQKIRLVGAGSMLTGGLIAIFLLRKNLAEAVRRTLGKGVAEAEVGQDLPAKVLLIGLAILVLPVAAINWFATGAILPTLVSTLLVYLAGFLFTAVAGYMAGVVGSSNNPISGVTILTLGATALLLVAMGLSGPEGQLATLLVGASIAIAAAIAGDTMQDLKTGHLVGSRPRNQQTSQLIGVISFAFVAPLVLLLLDRSIGIGSQGLLAPQAGVMSLLVRGVFAQGLDILMVTIGALSGIGVAILGLPVLPVAVGIYLPLSLTAPLFIGGLMSLITERYAKATVGEAAVQPVRERGILIASGVIAGEALVGLVMASVRLAEPGGISEPLFVYRAAVTPVLIGIGLFFVLLAAERKGWGLGVLSLGASGTAYLLWTRPAVDIGAGAIAALFAMLFIGFVMAHQSLRPYVTGEIEPGEADADPIVGDA